MERSIYQQEGRARAWFEFGLRLVGAGVLMLMALFGGGLDIVALAGSAAAVLIVQVVVSVVSAKI